MSHLYHISMWSSWHFLTITFYVNLIDVDECVETRDICENGKCTNTEGGVMCECPVGYRLSERPNSMRCIDVREEQCYDSYRRGQCTFPREGGMTKKHCCCTMGKAWGRYCEQCPSENSGKGYFLEKFIFLRNYSASIFATKYCTKYFY